MPTLTLYPATGRAVLSGVLHVGQQTTLAVVIDSLESATFASGHAYRLTIKRRGYLAADPYVQETLTVTGAKAATVALDLRLAALYAAIASRDTLATQWSVDDTLEGVLGWTASAAAIAIANTAARDGDVADPPAGVGITADDLAAALASLEGLSLASQAEAEAGTETAVRSWSPLRIWQGVVGKLLSILTTAGTVLYRGGSGLAALTLRTTVRATGTADDTSLATEAGIRAGLETRYRQQTPATAAEKGGASVAPDFAPALTLPWTLTSNLTSFAAATNLADGETGMLLITIGAYSLPANPPAGSYKGAWTVTGPLVRVVVERIGSVYLWSADSLKVVS